MDEISAESVPSRKWEGETGGSHGALFHENNPILIGTQPKNLGDIEPINLQFGRGEE